MNTLDLKPKDKVLTVFCNHDNITKRKMDSATQMKGKGLSSCSSTLEIFLTENDFMMDTSISKDKIAVNVGMPNDCQ